MEQQVSVVAIEGDMVLVQGKRATACGKCAGQSSCSTMGSWVERVAELRVKNTLQARVGDQVLLDVPDALLLKVSFQLYALPMLAFVFVGALTRALAVEMAWWQPDAMAALAGIAAVLACYALIRARVSAGRNSLDARMVQVIRSADICINTGPSIPLN
ncbi:MAG: positive regulator for alginate biosynthesis MucC [Zetaproteobacteria bacterium CG12_big_fil_rev_8_21_14_0_65_54_13]|nr:MAG: positive regulator for alginate biosynthesis MucC [Zetaproteobacteria bacterium CG23_combo_of_CG06-09_8_20_14_all_54_7]PIW48770.1 MAG: positive regulator for alginate biosynthesis MucC [Zetaproteobacteria bacterium CG12_big_fil_rev_8_21_14_0_65_54_13]PIX53580.1 MAG: positive regulator for alginate biosynthesis MucC [Zetaproteobacteria bacterium CG_4_10_14_3_um_filter_54_28]PJA31121.1 MAG: positive regulator for alginate biosynthesis MucC [Zetaproteobacteria bacterium CG_4_9_14_3_um_filte